MFRLVAAHIRATRSNLFRNRVYVSVENCIDTNTTHVDNRANYFILVKKKCHQLIPMIKTDLSQIK